MALTLLAAAKGALAALSQPKTFPADVECARKFLRDGIEGAERPATIEDVLRDMHNEDFDWEPATILRNEG